MEYPFIKGPNLEIELQRIIRQMKPGDVITVNTEPEISIVKHLLMKMSIANKDIPVICNRKFKIGDTVKTYECPGIFDIVSINNDTAVLQTSCGGEGLISVIPKPRTVSVSSLVLYTRR